MGLATSIAVTLALIASLGLGDAMTKFVAEYYRRDEERGARYASVIIWGAVVFSISVFTTLFATQKYWRAFVFPAEVSTRLIGLCLCLGFLNLVFALLLGAFAGLQLFKELTALNLLQAVSMVVLAVFLAFYSTEGALLAYVGGSGVSIIWGVTKLWQFDRRMLLPPGLHFLELRTVIYFSAPIWIGYFVLSPVVTYAYAFLASRPSGTFELGLFSTAIGLRTIVTILPGVVGIVISPALIQEAGTHGQHAAYETLLEKSFLSLVFLTLPLLVLFVFLADFVFLVYGRAFGSAYRLFAPLAASAAIGAIGAPLIVVMNARNRTWWSLGFGIIKSVFLVLLAFWWVPAHLSVGLSWAFLVSETSFYLIAIEFCIGIGVLPQSVRKVFYTAGLAVGVILILAMTLPNMARWIAAVPVSVGLDVFLVRAYPSLGTWLSESLPNPVRPRAQSILSFISS
jgi:O-antigen/teichoic acid export membrane protein